MRRHAGIEVEWCSLVFGKESLSVSLGKKSPLQCINFQQLPSTSPFRGAISHRPRQASERLQHGRGPETEEPGARGHVGPRNLPEAHGAADQSSARRLAHDAKRFVWVTLCASMCHVQWNAPCAERFTSCKTRQSCWRKKWAGLYHALERTCRASSMDWAWLQTRLKKLKAPSINELCRLDKTFWFHMFPSSVFDHQSWGQFRWVSFIGEAFAWSICAVRLRIARPFQCSSMIWAFTSNWCLKIVDCHQLPYFAIRLINSSVSWLRQFKRACIAIWPLCKRSNLSFTGTIHRAELQLRTALGFLARTLWQHPNANLICRIQGRFLAQVLKRINMCSNHPVSWVLETT